MSNQVPARVPEEHLHHKVIRASAGSGKTHELSGRYLSLLAAGEQPSSILASTFTRLAAGEIRDRLLKRLAEAVDCERARGELAQSLGVKSVSREQAMAMLRSLASNLHTLKAGTLDGFFASVVFAFAIELRLPLGAMIIDEPDNQSLRLEAIRLMLDEQDPQDMIELLRLLTRGQSERYVTDTIDRVVDDLYELWRECPDQAWGCVPQIDGELSRAELAEAIDRLANCAVPPNKSIADAHRQNLHAALARDWNAFLRKGVAAKVLDGQTIFNRNAIPPQVIAAYQPVVRHAVAEMVGRLRDQTLATRDLLKRFHSRYQALKAQHRVLTFTDLTHAMAAAVSSDDALDAISFRLDAQIRHMLLDEFQDTSIAQWRALAPLSRQMTEVRPPERTFFCVGDLKQSIYGWRGANPEILEHLPHLLPGLAEESLDRSWRSSPVIIDLVNDVFSSLTSNSSLAMRDNDDTHAIAADLWQATFNTHKPVERNLKLPGYVQMRFGPAVKNKDRVGRRRERLQTAAQLTADLHRDAPHARIALLTRTNDAVAWLLYHLGANGIPASGRGGGPLIDAPPVNALLDLLHLADHPDDTVSAFNIASSPLGDALGFKQFKVDAERRRLARQTREALVQQGYQATLAKWAALIAGACDARELRRAMQLVELAGTFDHQQTLSQATALRPGDFIRLVEIKEIPDSQPAPVEVMTIHQAKGLEFDAVVLAELDWPLRGKDPSVVFERDERSGEIARISRWIKSDVLEHLPELQPMSRQHRIRTIRESLSLLYVAMTRPRQALYLLVDPPSESERDLPRNAGGLLRGGLLDDGANQSPDTIVLERGEAEWWRNASAREDDSSAKSAAPCDQCDRIVLARDDDDALRGESAASASMFAQRAAARSMAAALREQLQLISPEGRERGTVIHKLFEQVDWLEDFALDDDALTRIAQAICPRRDERWHRRQVAAFRTMLQKPAIAQALSRDSRSPASLRLHREHPYARIVNGLVQTGSIDRLVLCVDAAGRATAATIIDFKTDALEAGTRAEKDLRAQAETHRGQLEMYRDAVAELFALPPQNITMQVMLTAAGAVLDL